MATYIKTLKEDNGDITYPQTKAGAVLLNNGSDLETELSQYVTAEDIASTSALTPPVQTNMIANGAVTSDKIASGAVPSTKIVNGAVTTEKLANKSVTSDKINWTKLQKYYKACSQVNPFNIPTAWKQTTPSGWTLTFTTNSGEIYKVEIVTGYLCWNGGGLTELDMHVVSSGATVISAVPSTMTGTYGGGVSIGRRASGILKATGNSMTVKVGVASGSTGNYARIDQGYILAERIA